MAEKSRMNLAALQQGDPYISEIIDVAVKVALYKFSQPVNSWSVTGIEGSLFVYRRSASPTFGLMILNTKDFNNFVQPLTGQVEFHLNTPFLLFKMEAATEDSDVAIHGIWFQERGECLRLTDTIQGIVRSVSGRSEEPASSSPPRASMPPAPPAPPSGPGPNILNLLSQAQKSYEVGRGKVKEHGASQEPGALHFASGDATGMAQITLDDLFRTANQHQAKAGLVDSSTNTQAKILARSMSVAELEAQAHRGSQGHPGPPTAQGAHPSPQGPPPHEVHPLLKMLGLPTKGRSREEVERLHGQGVKVSPGPCQGSRSPARVSGDASQDLMQMLTQGGRGSSGQAKEETDMMKRLIKMQDPTFGTNLQGFVPVSLPSGAHSVEDIEMSMAEMATPSAVKAGAAANAAPRAAPMPPFPMKAHTEPPRRREAQAPLPALLRPSDLDPSLARGKAKSSSPSLPPSTLPPGLLTPQAFSDPAPEAPPCSPPPSPLTSSTPHTTPLTQAQLQHTMVTLFQNDANFLSTIHSAYLDSFYAGRGNKS